MSVPTVPTEQSLTAWLTDRVAEYLRRPASDIDPGVPLAEYGLDSVAALSLCGDVEDHFGLPVDPTAAWDFPTVRALAGHLLTELAAQPPITENREGEA
ncbi:acyl carrier protein [Streptomyces sp. NPDC002577]